MVKKTTWILYPPLSVLHLEVPVNRVENGKRIQTLMKINNEISIEMSRGLRDKPIEGLEWFHKLIGEENGVVMVMQSV